MRRYALQVFCAALLISYGSGAVSSAQAQSAAAKASPELVNALSKELGASPDQAAGAAGTLFGIAKSKLSADQFSQIAKAVPGMDALLNAAPSAAPASASAAAPASAALSQLGAAAGSLAAAVPAFSKLGLKPEMVAKAVPVLTSFVTKSGGANVGNLLAGALK